MRAGDDAAHAEWVRLHEVRMLAFDHEEIVQYAVSTVCDAVTRPERWSRISNGVSPDEAMAALSQ